MAPTNSTAVQFIEVSGGSLSAANGVYKLINARKAGRAVYTHVNDSRYKVKWSTTSDVWMIDYVEGDAPYSCPGHSSESVPLNAQWQCLGGNRTAPAVRAVDGPHPNSTLARGIDGLKKAITRARARRMARSAEQVAASLRTVGVVLIVLFVFFGVLSIPGIIALVIGSKLVCCQSTAEAMKTQVGCLRCGSITGIVFAVLQTLGLVILGDWLAKAAYDDGYRRLSHDGYDDVVVNMSKWLIAWSLVTGLTAIWAFSAVLCLTSKHCLLNTCTSTAPASPPSPHSVSRPCARLRISHPSRAPASWRHVRRLYRCYQQRRLSKGAGTKDEADAHQRGAGGPWPGARAARRSLAAKWPGMPGERTYIDGLKITASSFTSVMASTVTSTACELMGK